MKQFLLISTGALVASVTLTSCQQEEQSCTKIANDLTELLKNVTDYDSAEAAAPRAAALWTRLINALGRPVDISGSSLHASSLDGGEALTKALEELTEQVARVYASYPALDGDDIDRDSLLRVVGRQGKISNKDAAADLDAGTKYLGAYKESESFESHASDKMPAVLECYGSEQLKKALDLSKLKEAEAVKSIFKVDDEKDIVVTPEFVAPANEEAKPEGESASSESTEETSSAESDDEAPEVDASSGEESTDEEPAAEETTDEEPAAEETTDEEPAEEETTDEEPAEEETTDEEPAEEEDTEEESSDEESSEDVDTSDMSFDLDI